MKLWLPCVILVGAILVVGCGDSSSDGSGQSMADRKAAVTRAKILRAEKKVARLNTQAARNKKKSAAQAAAAGRNGDLEAFLAGLPGRAGIVVGAPGGDGPKISGGDLTTGSAWSTIKIPISERVLDDFGGPSGISSAQADEMNRAITLSDNDAAAALFSDLESKHGGLGGASKAVGEMLRQAGDDETQISTVGRDGFSTYGQTEWSLSEQNRYMAALAGHCLANKADTDYILGLMSKTSGDDAFGLGKAGVPAVWKGGWGPGTDGKYLARQMGVLTVDGKQLVVTLAALPDDGTFSSAQAMVTEMATWAGQNLADDTADPVPC